MLFLPALASDRPKGGSAIEMTGDNLASQLEHCRSSRKPLHLYRPGNLPLILFLLVWLVLSGSSGLSLADETPVWKFDFRDVFYDVAVLSGQKTVIVGARGRVLVSHDKYPNLWSPRDSGTRELLTSLSFADDRSGWAAGHGGVILHTADGGNTWETQRPSSPQNQPLFDVQFLSTTVGYACGAYDTLLKTTDGGKNWEELTTGLDNIYSGLCFVNEREGFLVGEFCTLVRTRDGGETWQKIDLGGCQGSLFGVCVLPPNGILVYGISGRILKSEDDGSTWKDISPGVNQSLFRAAFGHGQVAIVGASGTILLSTPELEGFTYKTDEDLTTFAGISAHPEGGFVCVGEKGKIFRIVPPDHP